MVFDDANIDEAVAGELASSWNALYLPSSSCSGAVQCKFRNCGQTCVSANRIYVQSSIYAEFAARLAEKVAAFKVGNGLQEGTYVIALFSGLES